MINEETVKEMIVQILSQLNTSDSLSVPVEVSARHVHLSKEDVEKLFGSGHALTKKRDLSQPGQFLAEERVSIVTNKGVFHNVAVLGPERSHTQVELSLTDAKALGVKAPVRQSGDINGCPGIMIMSDKSGVFADESVIVAQNHIHMTPADAKHYGVTDGQIVKVRMATERPITFENVIIRVSEKFALAMHIDFDEANACQFEKGQAGYIVNGNDSKSEPVVKPEIKFSEPIKAECQTAVVKENVGQENKYADKKVITAGDSRSFAATGAKVFPVFKGMLVTPLAKDVFKENGVSIECKEA